MLLMFCGETRIRLLGALIGLLLLSPAWSADTRETSEGVVTFADVRRRFFYVLTPSGETRRFTFRSKAAPVPGEYLVVTGVPREGARLPTWEDAEFESRGERKDLMPLVRPTSIDELSRSPSAGGRGMAMNGRPVSVDGTVTRLERYGEETRLELNQANKVLTVVLLAQSPDPLPDFVEPRSRIRVSGTFECNYDYRILPGHPTVVSAFVYVDSAEAFSLLSHPPWLTHERSLFLIAVIGGVALTSLVWVLLLGRLVRRRTAALVHETRARQREEIETQAVSRERLRLAYDLHDDLQQLLTGTMCRIKAGFNYLERQNLEKATEQFAHARQSVGQTQTALHHILWGLRDAQEGPRSLAGLFAYEIDRLPQWKNVVRVSVEGTERTMSRVLSGTFLMILQEAVGNALQHGRATQIDVKLSFRAGETELSIADNGVGFDPSNPSQGPSHLGLSSMRLRAEQQGGTFDLVSQPGKGTTIRVVVPEKNL